MHRRFVIYLYMGDCSACICVLCVTILYSLNIAHIVSMYDGLTLIFLMFVWYVGLSVAESIVE